MARRDAGSSPVAAGRRPGDRGDPPRADDEGRAVNPFDDDPIWVRVVWAVAFGAGFFAVMAAAFGVRV